MCNIKIYTEQYKNRDKYMYADIQVHILFQSFTKSECLYGRQEQSCGIWGEHSP